MDETSPSRSLEIPVELAEFIKPELWPGERLIWAAVAKPRPMANRRPMVQAFSIAVVLFVLTGIQFHAIFGPTRPRYLAWETWILGSALIMAVVGIFALMVGLIAWDSGRQPFLLRTYALTDRRAVIWSPVEGTKAVEVVSLFAHTIQGLHRVEYPDGSGDLWFDRPPTDEDDFEIEPTGFFGIDEVRMVEALVRTILQPSGAGDGGRNSIRS